MTNPNKPALPIVLGRGRMADEVRAKIAAEPDRYRTETWGLTALGRCPCCEKDVYPATTRFTGWVPGAQTHAGTVHLTVDGAPPRVGNVRCCCVAPNWGPKHQEPETR